MTEPVMMKCGHASNSVYNGEHPACVICFSNPLSLQVEDNLPDLTGRESMCLDCKRTQPSKVTLPFFQHRPSEKVDWHYDGCRGWN